MAGQIKLRSNATLKTVAAHVDALMREQYARYQTASAQFDSDRSMHNRMAKDAAGARWSDLEVLGRHLNRLAGE